MLSPAELDDALKHGLRSSGCCTRLCRTSATIEDGTAYRVAHNGIGPRDTDEQVVMTTAALGMNAEKFGQRVGAWLTGLHRGERVSLNAA